MEINLKEMTSIENTILKYGKEILKSDIFRQSASERHHIHGQVLDHTISVCVVSLWLARQLKSRGVDVCEKDLVQAALCHDLGMVGRDSKYKDTLDSWKDHPMESVRIARELIPDMSRQTEEMILSHMWPVAGACPGSNEAMLLCIADKYASMSEWKTWLTNNKYTARVKELLDNAVTNLKTV